jgi:hypothetical protein
MPLPRAASRLIHQNVADHRTIENLLGFCERTLGKGRSGHFGQLDIRRLDGYTNR